MLYHWATQEHNVIKQEIYVIKSVCYRKELFLPDLTPTILLLNMNAIRLNMFDINFI